MSSSIMQTCICFSAGNSGGSASFPSIWHVELGCSTLRPIVWSTAFQGRIGRRNQSQHPRCQIQIRVAVQRSDHGSHQIAHVDVQEDSMETTSFGGGAKPSLAQPLRLHVQEEGKSQLHYKQNPSNDYTSLLICCKIFIYVLLSEIRGRISP